MYHNFQITELDDGLVTFHVPKEDSEGYINNKKDQYKFKFEEVFPEQTQQDTIFDKVGIKYDDLQHDDLQHDDLQILIMSSLINNSSRFVKMLLKVLEMVIILQYLPMVRLVLVCTISRTLLIG